MERGRSTPVPMSPDSISQEAISRKKFRLLAFEGDSKVVWFEGNYSEYEADRKARLGAAADQPHRIKYRHLTRK